MSDLHEALAEKIDGYLGTCQETVAYYQDQEGSSPRKATGALVRARFHLTHWEAEKRVLERHAPSDEAPTLCGYCIDSREASRPYPCPDTRDLAERCGVPVPA